MNFFDFWFKQLGYRLDLGIQALGLSANYLFLKVLLSLKSYFDGVVQPS
jgi:hypothetical protein